MKDSKILIVDDDRLIRELLCEYFRGHYTVDFAVDGKDGLEKVKSFDPDLIISDLTMPVLDGLEMVERLRQQQDDRLVLVFTAYGDAKSIIRAMRLRVFDFLAKPMPLAEIDQAVRVALQSKMKTSSTAGPARDASVEQQLLKESAEVLNQTKLQMAELLKSIERLDQLCQSYERRIHQHLKKAS